MPIIVMGTGRSGTTMTVEILRCSPLLTASDSTEDSGLFNKDRVAKNYLTKCDISYIKSPDKIVEFFNRNPGTKFIWCIRDPRDMVLSKIFRGQPGQDSSSLCDDATQQGCLDHMNRMFSFYKFVISHFNNDVIVLKMEDIILNFDETVINLCNFASIQFEDKMRQFYLNYRVIPKKNRYNNLDKSQIALWQDWPNVYGGFFKNNRKYDIPKLFNDILPICQEFGYIE